MNSRHVRAPQDLLHQAKLYLCTDARLERKDFADFADAAYRGGVDIIQLRDKTLEAAQELEVLDTLSAIAERHGKLWAVNDRADIAALSGAPVLHGGQLDLSSQHLHEVASAGLRASAPVLVGQSTHEASQVDRARSNPYVDYFCTGPVWATPTKPGRQGVGLELVKYAAETEGATGKPWFAIGGIDLHTVAEVVAAGATRVVVVRAITDAQDPEAAARALRDALA